MTDDIKVIKKKIAGPTNDLAYYAAIGETEYVKKLALVQLIDIIYPIYVVDTKAQVPKNQIADRIDIYIQDQAKKYTGFNIKLPDYISSGTAFIEYMDRLNGVKPTEEKQADSDN